MKQGLKKESETLRSISFYGTVDVTKFDIILYTYTNQFLTQNDVFINQERF